MQLVTPKVVAIAVKMEMAICKMVFQVSFFIIVVFLVVNNSFGGKGNPC